jgi:hypothetical protein
VYDTRFMTVDIPPSMRDVSDEVLLAQFVKGFFGGWVFFPESVVLKLVGMQLTKPSGACWRHWMPESRRIGH